MTQPAGPLPPPSGAPWGPPPGAPPVGRPTADQPWGAPAPYQGPGARLTGTAAYAGVPRAPEPQLRDPSKAADVVVAVVLGVALGLPSLAIASAANPLSALAAVVAAVVMPVAAYWRRSLPVRSAVVVYAAALVHFSFGAPLLATDLIIFLALYSVTAHGPVWASRLALAGALLGSVLQAFVIAGSNGPGLWGYDGSSLDLARIDLFGLVFFAGLLGIMCILAWSLGLLRRSRLAHTETLAERARRLETERDQQAQIATAAERSRIAREMHDVVAHSLSVVIAQADGGRYAAAADPDAAVRSLTTISETGRAALADMRKILGILRAPESAGQAQSTTPQPVDADLDILVEQVRSSGLDVSLVRVGESRQLPPGLGLSVYRICQEALTNVLKHGGPSASATVLLQWAPQRLTVQVDDTGRGAAATSDGAGHGLLGMQERVTLFAGTLETGAKPGGGFRVRAEIPLPGGAPSAGAYVLGATTPVPGVPAPLAPASWPQHQQNGTP